MRKIKVSNLIYVLVMLTLLTAGLVFVLLSPVDINEYENRGAKKIEKFGIDAYLKGEFQDSIESALADQLPGSSVFKKFYNVKVSEFSADMLNYALNNGGKTRIAGGDIENPPDSGDGGDQGKEETIKPEYGIDVDSLTKSERRDLLSFDMTLEEIYPKSEFDPNAVYNRLGNYWLWEGHLMYDLFNLNDSNKASIAGFADMINGWAADMPECRFCAFFLEKETEMHFLTGERTGFGEYVLDKLDIPEEDKSIYKLHSFGEFDSEFFKTDHHWNNRGAYRGYKVALASLLPEEEPLEVLDELYAGRGSGTKAMSNATASLKEDFNIYEFDFPESTVNINNYRWQDYGNQGHYCSNAKNGLPHNALTYGEIYGWDYAEVVIDRKEDTGNGNILVIGSSYDNATVKLIASHYDCLYSIDFRYYYDAFGGFDMKNYIEKHNISTVLFFGDSSFYADYGFMRHN